MEKLTNDWHIAPYWLPYLVLGFSLQVVIRAIMSGFSAKELAQTRGRFWVCYRQCFIGEYDLGLSFFIGWLELYSFPVMMATGAWTVIGAWLGFKTVAQLRTWQENRFFYNRYLLGNALVVLSSLVFLVRFVTVTPPGCAP